MAQTTPKETTKTTTMTVNLRKRLLRLHATRRRKRVLGLLAETVARFSKSDVGNVRIDKDLNDFVLKKARGSSFIWAKLKVNVEKTGDKTEVKMYATKAAQPAQATAAKPAKALAKPEDGKKAEPKEKKETKEPKTQKQA